MSGDATGWVWKHSPLNGSDLIVHLAIADVVNDAHDNEFWMRASNLATKARVHRDTARVALRKMEDLGLIETVELVSGGPTKYRFLMPHPADLTEGGPRISRRGPRGSYVGDPAEVTYPIGTEVVTQSSTQLELNAPASLPSLRKAQIQIAFEHFWEVYPRIIGRKAATKAFEKAVREVGLERVMDGARRYAADPNLPTDKQFIPHPATWLNQGRWDDEPCAPRGGASKQSSTDRQRAVNDRVRARLAERGIR